MSTDQQIAERITHYIVTEVASAPPETPPPPDFPLIEGGLVDSLGLFKLIAWMEDELKISVAPEEILFENFATVNDIIKLVRAKQGA
jgi:acyl carrier protein